MILTANSLTGDIDISDDGMKLEAFRKLYNDDKTQGKSYFKKVLKYIYHCYKKEHALHNLTWNMREEKVLNEYFDGEGVRYLKANKYFDSCIEQYKECEYTLNQLTYERIKEDLYDLKKHISNIKFFKKQKVKQSITVQTSQGEEEVFIDMEIEIDNSEEKIKALNNMAKLLELEDKYKSICIKELGNKNDTYTTMKDKGFNIKKK